MEWTQDQKRKLDKKLAICAITSFGSPHARIWWTFQTFPPFQTLLCSSAPSCPLPSRSYYTFESTNSWRPNLAREWLNISHKFNQALPKLSFSDVKIAVVSAICCCVHIICVCTASVMLRFGGGVRMISLTPFMPVKLSKNQEEDEINDSYEEANVYIVSVPPNLADRYQHETLPWTLKNKRQ